MFSALLSSRRRFAGFSFSVFLASLGALELSGCGGGGGGGGGGGNGGPTPTAPPNTTLFSDDFSGNSLNTSLWGVYDSSRSLQRTQFGATPQIVTEGGTTFARFNMNTYNAGNGNQVRGTEIFSKARFQNGEGLEYEARVRGTNIPPGVIFAAFMLYDRYTGAPSDATYRKTEIDYEFLGSALEQLPAPSRNYLYLNIWDEWNQPRDGFDGNDAPDSTRTHDDKTYGRSRDANYDWANWNTYRIRWYPDRTEFFVNDLLERTEREVRPQQPMALHFNIWAATSDFSQAYSASLQPTNQANNRNLYFDVDYVRVRSLGTGAGTVGGVTLNSIPRKFVAR